MKLALLVLLICSTTLSAVTIGNWNNIRFSAKTASNQVFVRKEMNLANIAENKIIYHNGTQISEYDFLSYPEFPGTFQAPVPMGTSRKYIGLKLKPATSAPTLLPLYYPGTVLPGVSELTQVSSDPVDGSFTNYLDILKDRVSFSDRKIYTAIENRGGGFPTSINFGTVYLSYMSVIAAPGTNPNDPGVIVWALNYMNVPLGGISPGLFKITGTSSSDLIRIGNIETQIVGNTLIMSCNVSDLLADPDFAAWYQPSNPSFDMTTLTSRTTVIPFATTQIDDSAGCHIVNQSLYIDPNVNQLPHLENLLLYKDGISAYFELLYYDEDENFPLTTDVTIDNLQTFTLHPTSADFSGQVVYRTSNIFNTLNEYDDALAVFNFSDDNIVYDNTYFAFSYLRSLTSPTNTSQYISGDNLVIDWDAVTETLDGTPVTTVAYRIESSDLPDFSTYTALATTPSTVYTIPLISIEKSKFYRIVAIKD